jgi:hypothetical protein
METALKLDLIVIEDKYNLSSDEILQRANEIAQTRGFENGWQISEVKECQPPQQRDGLRIYHFDLFGFESVKTSSDENGQKISTDNSHRSVAAPPSEI